MTSTRSVAIVSLGCARNDVDSEELAGRLDSAGWQLVADPAEADVTVVNTCGFIEQAKQDSVDTLLAAAALRDGEESRTKAVVAVGCLAERYGTELAASLPEADAVLGFDSYPALHEHLRAVLDGQRPASHVPRDRRTLLPLAPSERPVAQGAAARPAAAAAARPAAAAGSVDPAGPVGPAAGPPVVRARLDDAPWAPLKLASGCDRRCAFCAIPSFRGSFVSRRPADVLAEARWLADSGVRELFLVSENTTSYGKDLGDLDLLESLLPELAAVPGITRVRASYLQPFELRPGLLERLATTPGVAPYFDLPFQHAAAGLLRRMRRFGGTADFLALLERVRALAPQAGVRSNVIVGFPGEREQDLAELLDFLGAARLDAIGVFPYSDEEGTEAATLAGHLDEQEIAARTAHVQDVVDELVSQRAEERVGEQVAVLVENPLDAAEPEAVEALARAAGAEGSLLVRGRAAHQGPEVDGETVVVLPPAASAATSEPGRGELLAATVVASSGADLVAVVPPAASP